MAGPLYDLTSLPSTLSTLPLPSSSSLTPLLASSPDTPPSPPSAPGPPSRPARPSLLRPLGPGQRDSTTAFLSSPQVSTAPN
jgi:hypothetical protein